MTQPPPEDRQTGIPFAVQLFAPAALLAIAPALARVAAAPSTLFFLAGVVSSIVYSILCFARVQLQVGTILGLLAALALLAFYGAIASTGCSYIIFG